MAIFGLIGLKAGTNAIGKLAANSGVDIGDVDVLSLPAISGAVSLIPNSGSGSYTATYTAAQTDTELVAAPGAGVSIYLTDVIISNGATAGTVTIEEDTASAKTAKINSIFCAVNGGAVIRFNQPIKLTANKNLGIKSATVTTHSVTVNYYTGA